jgi:hypothetical protein
MRYDESKHCNGCRRHSELCMEQVRGPVGAQKRVGVMVRLAIASRPQLLVAFKVGTELSGIAHELGPEITSFSIVTSKRCIEMVMNTLNRVRKTLGVECRLRHAGNHVRSRDKGGISKQHRAAEHKLWTFDIDNSLEKRLFGPLNESGDRRG